jgi:integrase
MSGHIRRRGERSWEIKFDLGTDPVTGKRETRYHSFKGTKRQAEAELTRLTAEAQRGSYVEATTETVGAFMDRWSRDWATANVSPKTLERYNELIRNQVRHIGSRPMQKLRPVDLNELYAKLLHAGLAPRTVGHVHRLLHRAFSLAMTWDVVQKNVASSVRPPRVPEEEIEIIREDNIKAVLQKLRGRPLYPITTLALATGLRRGELLALRWQDIDLDCGTVRVERSLEETQAGGLRFKAPKTKQGRRSITIPPSIIAELRAHRKDQQEHRLAIGAGKAPADALVFPAWNGSPRSPNALSKEWRAAMIEAEMKVSLHALRHTHASSLIAAGVDILTISRRLGHASPSITLDVYGHLFKNTDDRAAVVIEALFGKVRGSE